MPVPLRALLAFGAYMRDAIDLRESDVFWNIADPGWAYGLYCADRPCCWASRRSFTKAASTPKPPIAWSSGWGDEPAGSPTAYRLLIAAAPRPPRAVRGPARGQFRRRALNPR